MFKFNDDNIFTGYIKQLLASFNLPKYHVYTREQQEYHDEYLRIQATNKQKIIKLGDEIVGLTNKLTNLNGQEKEKTQAKIKELCIELDELTEELEKYSVPELNILASSYRNDAPAYSDYDFDKKSLSDVDYPAYMRYIPYIKDDKIQIYAPKAINGQLVYSSNDWKDCHFAFGNSHTKVHGKENIYVPKGYAYNLKVKNYTKNLKIQNNIYDSYTHEYLGDYLRFQRDYNRLNLMPLYNCFSNRVSTLLDVEFVVSSDYTAQFKSADKNYKIYMVPIKLFQKYTIAIDCSEAVEMCCGLYGKYPYEEKYNVLMQDTYTCYNSMQFTNPVLFDKALFLNKYTELLDNLELAQHEDDLKLFIKLPFENKSSITVLEGDYTNCTTPIMYKFSHPGYVMSRFRDADTDHIKAVLRVDNGIIALDDDKYAVAFNEGDDFLNITTRKIMSDDTDYSKASSTDEDELKSINFDLTPIKTMPAHKADSHGVPVANETVINYDGDLAKIADKLSTPLQLLKLNTGTSYPFADRLIEYLIGNAITHVDEIADNVKRAKTVAAKNNPQVKTEAGTRYLVTANGIWTPELRAVYYNYMNRKKLASEVNHDLLGYVDKDVEQNYSYQDDNGSESILSVNIYDDDEWED